MTEATTSNYWISSTALYIELNAIGNPDYIQASCVSEAKILVYVKDIIGYDAGHNYRRWTLQAAPTVFNTHTAKYVYFAIPKSEASDKPALVVYPSEKVDIYGKNASGKQVGDDNYYYIYSQGIISDSGTMGTTSRTWKARVQTGILSSDEALSSMGGEGQWWEYSSVDDMITFLKDIWKGTIHYLTVAKQIIFNGHTLTGVTEDGTDIESTQHIVTPKWGDDHWLSSVHDDKTEGHITFNAGLTANQMAKLNSGATFGDSYSFDKSGNIVSNSLKVNDLYSFDEFGNIIAKALGINGKYSFDADGNIIADTVQSADYNYSEQTGFGFYRRKDGKFGLNITDLMIWGKAIFNSLEIRKLYSVGGNIVLSPSSSRIMKVDEVTDEVTGEVTGWKCYLLADDGTTATTNQWMVDDQARCQTFDIEEGIYENVSNKNYWRRITEVSSKNEVITDDNGVTLYDGKKFAWVIISKGDCMEGSDEPSADDTIVCMGNRTNTDRQHMLIMETVGDHAPSICLYRGVNGYSLAGCSIFDVSHDGVNVVSKYFKLTAASGEKVWSPVYLGEWQEGKTYGYYDQVDHEGTLWLCIAPEGTEVTEEPQESSAYWRAVTAIVPVEMKISRDFDGFRYGTVGNIQCSVFRGVTDLTGCVTTWKVSRDSGSEQDDTAWGLSDKAKNFDGSLRLACNAQENDFGSGDTVTFTFTAIGDTNLLATRSLMFV